MYLPRISHVSPMYLPCISQVQQLVQMGFSREASVAALQKAQGSVEVAMDHLLGGS